MNDRQLATALQSKMSNIMFEHSGFEWNQIGNAPPYRVYLYNRVLDQLEAIRESGIHFGITTSSNKTMISFWSEKARMLFLLKWQDIPGVTMDIRQPA